MNQESHWLHEGLGIAKEEAPFPWQEELLGRFKLGRIERSLDIPTGLGKTAVMAIWLVARALGARLPRRLVYVVDRRAVVDQATDVAIGLRDYVDRNAELKRSLGLDRPLPISTLRGQHVDNREWLEDPASPAIIVGTVDMIGSRLLFEGYGTSRKMRPYQAGLIGADTLVVLDEAHLVPPFEQLLQAVAEGTAAFGPCDESLREIVPPFKLMSLSATGRSTKPAPFGLTRADLEPGSLPRKRLDAPKRLEIIPLDDPKSLVDELAKQAWDLANSGAAAVRIIVFCDRRKDAEATGEAIQQLAKGDNTPELLVGGRRVFERQKAADRLKELGFIAGAKVAPDRATFLVATSVGLAGFEDLATPSGFRSIRRRDALSATRLRLLSEKFISHQQSPIPGGQRAGEAEGNRVESGTWGRKNVIVHANGCSRQVSESR